MKTIWDVYEYNYVRMNKEQSGRTLTQSEFNKVINVAILEYLKLKIGLPEMYQVGAPIAPQQWQLSQKISDDCRHLLKWMGGSDAPYMSIDEYGVSEVPSDYVAFSSCYYEQEYKKDCESSAEERLRSVEFVADAVWADRVSSSVKKPTEKYPIAKWYGNKIQFAPNGLRYVHFTYLRKPKTAYLAVTIDANNDYVYNESGSEQIEFPDICLPDIANMVFGIMAGQIQSQLYIQSSESRKQRGI